MKSCACLWLKRGYIEFGVVRVFPRNNKVWAHGPMSMKFDGPFL